MKELFGFQIPEPLFWVIVAVVIVAVIAVIAIGSAIAATKSFVLFIKIILHTLGCCQEEDNQVERTNCQRTKHKEGSFPVPRKGALLFYRWSTPRIRFRIPLKRGFLSTRRREATCAVRAFGLLEYSRSSARSWSCDESRGERRGRGSATSH